MARVRPSTRLVRGHFNQRNSPTEWDFTWTEPKPFGDKGYPVEEHCYQRLSTNGVANPSCPENNQSVQAIVQLTVTAQAAVQPTVIPPAIVQPTVVPPAVVQPTVVPQPIQLTVQPTVISQPTSQPTVTVPSVGDTGVSAAAEVEDASHEAQPSELQVVLYRASGLMTHKLP
ncbi:hypothetical protein IW262DRAFT_1469771 [Armillaria fumosa]|nr:hypothetical protein IW262DRAFT_1469771 [Armillaria fumosa]